MGYLFLDSYFFDISKPFHVRPVLLQDLLAEWINFALPYCLEAARPFQPELESPNAREKRANCKRHHTDAPQICQVVPFAVWLMVAMRRSASMVMLLNP